MQPRFHVEQALIEGGGGPVAGVDEAGRGPLAGPVVAAAVILVPDRVPAGVRDSKTLSAASREALAADIVACARAVAVGWATAAEIDAIDIRKASLLAMRRAVLALCVRPGHVLVDGRDVPLVPCAATAIVKGDRDVVSIAAASIVAKTARDRMMARLALALPAYGFDRHFGYPTAVHRAALVAHGPCMAHRLSFRLLAE